jgi:hypothetical protein
VKKNKKDFMLLENGSKKIFENKYNELYKTHIKKELYKGYSQDYDTSDDVLNLLFDKHTFPLYKYDNAITKGDNAIINVKMIKCTNDAENVLVMVVDIDGDKYYYYKFHYEGCCGSGEESYVLMNDEQ